MKKIKKDESNLYQPMMDKAVEPTDEDMIKLIGQPIAKAWTALREFLVETYDIEPILDSGGKKYGWNLQHRAGRKPLCEMYPEHSSFTALVILGKKELEKALQRVDTFGDLVRKFLIETPRYHDGCWMYIRIYDPISCFKDVEDIKQLILIKKKPPKKLKEK